MARLILRVALLVGIAGVLPLQPAHADIYTWADPSGSINVSNLKPPDGARVISVEHASPEGVAARENAARDAARRAETLALEDRVRQLEADAEARRQPPPQVVYPMIPAPPAMAYRVDPAPPPVQYTVYSSPPAYTMGCDPGWMDCGLGWYPNFYSTGVVFVRAPSFRRFPSVPVGRHFVGSPPMRSFGHSARG